MIRLSPKLSVVAPSSWLPLLLYLMPLYLSERKFFLFSSISYSRLILYLPCPNLEISNFPAELWFLLVTMVLRKEAVGPKYTHYVGENVAFQLLQPLSRLR